jgi:hypothetical protein
MSERINELLNKVNLNWKVRTEPIRTKSGIILDGYSAIIREDNQKPLSVRSDGYHPYQNHELLELLDKVSTQIGLPIHNGGSFGGGGKVFIQLKSNDLKLGSDKIEGYITGINSFDGSTSLAFGNSNVTISCQNTFFAAYREVQSKVRHTKNMSIKIDEICKGIEGFVKEEKEIFQNIKKLSEVKVDQKVKDLVTRMLFNVDRQVDLQDEDAISTVTRNKITRYYIDLNGELKEKGDNMWGLFSGVTKYTTHSLTKNDNTEAKLFGQYGNRERQIFRELVELV